MIELQNLSARYLTDIIFQDVNFSLVPGRVVALMGPSGCGKSTLLRLLMGLEKQGSGALVLDGVKHNAAQWKNQGRMFSIVPQVPHLFPWKTVFENVELAVPAVYSKLERKERVNAMLENVQLAEHAHKFPSEISLGMAARVSFARALMLESKCVLFDEPFASLDAHTRRELQEWLASRVQNLNVPALFVTHDAREALFLSHQIVVLQGKPSTSKTVLSLPLVKVRQNQSPEQRLLFEAQMEQKIGQLLSL